MSDVYAGGNKATAVAAIKAAISARWVTIADGSKDLDRESLTAWLRAEFDSMIGDAEATSASYIAGIDVNALVAAVNAKVRREAFMGRSDWPAVNTTSAPQAVGAAVRERLAELQRLSADITAFYANTATKMFDVITAYIQANVEGTIPAGVDRIERTSALIYTYVTDRGEESANSPASVLFTRDQNDTYTATVSAPPSGRNITHFRLYEGNTTNLDDAFQKVPNPAAALGLFPVDTLTVTVTCKPEELLEPCATMTWEEPPADAKFACSIGNGVHLVASGNSVRPCPPYVPYAYPPGYAKTTSHPITGMCAIDGLAVVGTMGPLKVLAGNDSQNLSEIQNNSGQSIVSARSMVAMSYGVIAGATPDGIAVIDRSGQVKVVTDESGFDLFTREDWQALSPADIFAAELEGCYVFHVGTPGSGYCYSLDLRSGRLVKIDATGSAFYRDQLTDTLYMAGGTTIKAIGTGETRRTATWKSKRITLDSYANFSWLQVNSDFGANVTVRITHRLTKPDNTVVTTTTTHTAANLLPQKIPTGRSNDWDIEVEGTVRVQSVTLASSISDLKQVGS